MKFHITIKDNETGEIIHDKDTNAIIGAINGAENSTAVIGITSCNTIELLATMRGALQSVKEIRESNPKISLMEDLISMCKKMKGEFSEKKEYN